MPVINIFHAPQNVQYDFAFAVNLHLNFGCCFKHAEIFVLHLHDEKALCYKQNSHMQRKKKVYISI